MAGEARYDPPVDHDKRQELALWRYSVLGPLVSVRLAYGDRRALFQRAAELEYEHPDGRLIKISPRTIEGWYYDYKHGGLTGLEPKTRKDAGQARAIDDQLTDLILRAKLERPRRTIRWLIRVLERGGWAPPGKLHPATVHRLLKRHGVSTRPPREHDQRERRSYLFEEAGDLWFGDAMHGPFVLVGKRLRKTYLISMLDCATRFLPGSVFHLSESALDHELVLRDAVAVHGPPRTYYVDRGAPYMARSLKLICAALGIHLVHTKPRDPEAKGAIERWHRTWHDSIGCELVDKTLTLDELNAIHRAWLAEDYLARVHDTTRRAPKEHFLAQVAEGHVRRLPRGFNLDEAFWQREKRLVRKDGTVSLHNKKLEVRGEFIGQRVELRFDPRDPDFLPRVFVDGAFACDTVLLDRHQNAHRRRRALPRPPSLDFKPTDIAPISDLLDAHYRASTPRTHQP